jgi:hypothetical protein
LSPPPPRSPNAWATRADAEFDRALRDKGRRNFCRTLVYHSAAL